MRKLDLKKTDFFYILMVKGVIKECGTNKDLTAYRIIEYDGQEFKLTVERIKVKGGDNKDE